MHKITEQEIQFMLDDMKKRGIRLEELQENLLDHMCCIIEDEMKEGSNFYDFYNNMIPRFFEKTLSEIQEETNNLLRFKHYYSMKKTLNITGIATVIFTFLGAILKTFHLPGAGITIVLGGFIFSFIFLPLLIIIKFKDDDSKTDKAVFSFGLIVGILLSIGVIFKLMHWPGANILMLGSTVTFTFIYVPIYFFSRFSRPELKFNTIVNTVLMFAIGGIFFALYDLSFSRKFSKEISQNHFFIHENSERIMASNLRLFENYNQSEKTLQLHKVSFQLNEQLEEVAAIIVKDKSAKNTSPEIESLRTLVAKYNEILNEVSFQEAVIIEDRGVQVLDRLSDQLALNTLARIQHQLAVNENCYLSARINQ